MNQSGPKLSVIQGLMRKTEAQYVIRNIMVTKHTVIARRFVYQLAFWMEIPMDETGLE